MKSENEIEKLLLRFHKDFLKNKQSPCLFRAKKLIEQIVDAENCDLLKISSLRYEWINHKIAGKLIKHYVVYYGGFILDPCFSKPIQKDEYANSYNNPKDLCIVHISV